MAAALAASVRTKLIRQGGVPTFFDNAIQFELKRLGLTGTEGKESRPSIESSEIELLVRLSKFRSRQRLAPMDERTLESLGWVRLPWELTQAQLSASQGVDECLTWRGIPLFKTAFDVALYPMLLAEVAPKTILELGSGPGGSALWFADVIRAHGLDTHIYSVDLHKPEVVDPRVTFIEGDCRDLPSSLPAALLNGLPHPWVVIEDMHAETLTALRYFAGGACRGDYLIVEDSTMKFEALGAFHREWGSAFRVDTRYTDFFGRNATCSADGVLVKIS
jgi:cephalosporin hydroxylase